MEKETRSSSGGGSDLKAGAISRLGFRLTARELECLEFILDQKFASLDALYLRFYQGPQSVSKRYAEERIGLLRKHGFLNALRVFTDVKTYFIATDLTQEILQGVFTDRVIQKPIESIDIRTFEHDKRVMLCRASREKMGQARDWISERRLKQELAQKSQYRLAREYMPDAIYTNQLGGKVAFELELSPKTQDRYAQKISKLLEATRTPEGPFQKVLYVTCSDSVHAQISSLTKPYSDRFFVLKFEEVVSEALLSSERKKV